MIKKWKQIEENCFFIFRKIFAPLEAKMMKHDKKNDKKNDKQMKKMKKKKRKIFEENCNLQKNEKLQFSSSFFHFSHFFNIFLNHF